MKPLAIIIRAIWDEDASVWAAQSSDIAGLALEAATLEELRIKVLAALPELIELNGLASDLPEIPVHFLAERSMRISNPRAAA